MITWFPYRKPINTEILSNYNIPVKFDGIKVLNSSVGKCLLSYLTIIYDKENSKPEHYEDILKRPNKCFKNDFIESIKVTGWFKGIRQSLRQVDVDKALIEYKVLMFKKITIYKNNPDITTETNDIEKELNYRNIIHLNGVTQTIRIKNKKVMETIEISF